MSSFHDEGTTVSGEDLAQLLLKPLTECSPFPSSQSPVSMTESLRKVIATEQRHEIVALTPGDRSLVMNWGNWNRFREESDKLHRSTTGRSALDEPTLVISFLGDTEVGKSHTIRSLMRDDEERPWVQSMREQKTSTTANVNLYICRSLVDGAAVHLVDYEGENGSEQPIALSSRSKPWVGLAGAFAGSPGSPATSNNNNNNNNNNASPTTPNGGTGGGGIVSSLFQAVAPSSPYSSWGPLSALPFLGSAPVSPPTPSAPHANAVTTSVTTAATTAAGSPLGRRGGRPHTRAEAVKDLFPRLAYTTSDVVAVVGTEPFFSGRYLQRVLEFAARANIGVGDAELPILLLISNRRDPDTCELDIKTSTQQFLDAMGDSIRMLDQYFTALLCVYLPNTRSKVLVPASQDPTPKNGTSPDNEGSGKTRQDANGSNRGSPGGIVVMEDSSKENVGAEEEEEEEMVELDGSRLYAAQMSKLRLLLHGLLRNRLAAKLGKPTPYSSNNGASNNGSNNNNNNNSSNGRRSSIADSAGSPLNQVRGVPGGTASALPGTTSRLITSRQGLWYDLVPHVVAAINESRPISVLGLLDEVWMEAMSRIEGKNEDLGDVLKSLVTYIRPPPAMLQAALGQSNHAVLQRFERFYRLACDLGVRVAASRVRDLPTYLRTSHSMKHFALTQVDTLQSLLDALTPCTAQYGGTGCGTPADGRPDPVLCLQEKRVHTRHRGHRTSRKVTGGGSSLWERIVSRLSAHTAVWQGDFEAPALAQLPTRRKLLQDALLLASEPTEEWFRALAALQTAYRDGATGRGMDLVPLLRSGEPLPFCVAGAAPGASPSSPVVSGAGLVLRSSVLTRAKILSPTLYLTLTVGDVPARTLNYCIGCFSKIVRTRHERPGRTEDADGVDGETSSRRHEDVLSQSGKQSWLSGLFQKLGVAPSDNADDEDANYADAGLGTDSGVGAASDLGDAVTGAGTLAASTKSKKEVHRKPVLLEGEHDSITLGLCSRCIEITHSMNLLSIAEPPQTQK